MMSEQSRLRVLVSTIKPIYLVNQMDQALADMCAKDGHGSCEVVVCPEVVGTEGGPGIPHEQCVAHGQMYRRTTVLSWGQMICEEGFIPGSARKVM